MPFFTFSNEAIGVLKNILEPATLEWITSQISKTIPFEKIDCQLYRKHKHLNLIKQFLQYGKLLNELPSVENEIAQIPDCYKEQLAFFKSLQDDFKALKDLCDQLVDLANTVEADYRIKLNLIKNFLQKIDEIIEKKTNLYNFFQRIGNLNFTLGKYIEFISSFQQTLLKKYPLLAAALKAEQEHAKNTAQQLSDQLTRAIPIIIVKQIKECLKVISFADIQNKALQLRLPFLQIDAKEKQKQLQELKAALDELSMQAEKMDQQIKNENHRHIEAVNSHSEQCKRLSQHLNAQSAALVNLNKAAQELDQLAANARLLFAEGDQLMVDAFHVTNACKESSAAKNKLEDCNDELQDKLSEVNLSESEIARINKLHGQCQLSLDELNQEFQKQTSTLVEFQKALSQAKEDLDKTTMHRNALLALNASSKDECEELLTNDYISAFEAIDKASLITLKTQHDEINRLAEQHHFFAAEIAQLKRRIILLEKELKAVNEQYVLISNEKQHVLDALTGFGCDPTRVTIENLDHDINAQVVRQKELYASLSHEGHLITIEEIDARMANLNSRLGVVENNIAAFQQDKIKKTKPFFIGLFSGLIPCAIGGAVLGSALGGFVGAVIGGVIGAVVGAISGIGAAFGIRAGLNHRKLNHLQQERDKLTEQYQNALTLKANRVELGQIQPRIDRFNKTKTLLTKFNDVSEKENLVMNKRAKLQKQRDQCEAEVNKYADSSIKCETEKDKLNKQILSLQQQVVTSLSEQNKACVDRVANLTKIESDHKHQVIILRDSIPIKQAELADYIKMKQALVADLAKLKPMVEQLQNRVNELKNHEDESKKRAETLTNIYAVCAEVHDDAQMEQFSFTTTQEHIKVKRQALIEEIAKATAQVAEAEKTLADLNQQKRQFDEHNQVVLQHFATLEEQKNTTLNLLTSITEQYHKAKELLKHNTATLLTDADMKNQLCWLRDKVNEFGKTINEAVVMADTLNPIADKEVAVTHLVPKLFKSATNFDRIKTHGRDAVCHKTQTVKF